MLDITLHGSVTRDMIVTLYNNHNTNSDVRCELRQPDIICCWGARDEESEYSLQLIDITAVQTRAWDLDKKTHFDIIDPQREEEGGKIYSVFTHLVINEDQMKINVCPLL